MLIINIEGQNSRPQATSLVCGRGWGVGGSLLRRGRKRKEERRKISRRRWRISLKSTRKREYERMKT